MEISLRVGIPLAIFVAVQFVGYAFSAETRNFKNERCMPRETLVHVDQINGVYFFPLVVKLHRCGGSCLNVPPNKRKCIAKTVEKIPISVKKLANFRERSIIHMENETSCDCPCTINESSCNLERQIFDDQACKCKCRKRRFSLSFRTCNAPFQYHAPSCGCNCHLRCNHLQNLDEKSCRCRCKASLYEECRSVNKYVQPDSCRCISLNEIQKSTGKTSCDELPSKWLAILILMGSAIVVLLAFNCILCGKKARLLHKLFPCCQREKSQEGEEMGTDRILTERG